MEASRVICAYMLGLSLTVGGCAAAKGQQAGSMGNEYKMLLEQQKLKAAASAATEQESRKKLPELNAAGYERLGDEYVRQGNLSMALIKYGKSLQLDSGAAGVRIRWAASWCNWEWRQKP